MEMGKMKRGRDFCFFCLYVCWGEWGKINFDFEMPRGVFRWAYETGIRGQEGRWGPPGCQSLPGWDHLGRGGK